jgi:hypothetical protein
MAARVVISAAIRRFSCQAAHDSGALCPTPAGLLPCGHFFQSDHRGPEDSLHLDLPASWRRASKITAGPGLLFRVKTLLSQALGRSTRLAGSMRLRRRCYELRFTTMAGNVA